MPKSLLCIEIETPTTVWNRTLLGSLIPTEEDLQFYYSTLLGLEDARIMLKIYEVPNSFNEALLSVIDRAPVRFPVYDLESDIVDVKKREQYTNFINQLCEMEKSREALQVFIRSSEEKEPTSTRTTISTAHLNATRAWVDELLHKLNDEYDYEESGETTEMIVASRVDDFVPAGWVFTPTNDTIRKAKGSRIVLNAEVGKKWERLLGTDVYPDMIVSRRISTLNWAFQHETSETLIRATLDWYLAAQDTKIVDGITDWIMEADKEMNALFATFRRIKVNERLIMESLPKVTEKQSKAFKLISSIESRLLCSAINVPTIHPCTPETFRKYINYMLKGYEVEKEIYARNEAIDQIVTRWVRSQMGFRPEVEPLLSNWCEMWKVVIRGNPTEERVAFFVRTLDSWDPIECTSITTLQRQAMGAEWINIFIDNECIFDEKCKVRSTILHERARKWCYKFVSESVFPTIFSPMTIGPLFSHRGLLSVKEKDGRHTRGMRFRNPDSESEMATSVIGARKVHETKVMNVVVETAENGTIEKHMMTQSQTTVTKSEDDSRIEHFFCAASSVTTTKQEIHLGTL